MNAFISLLSLLFLVFYLSGNIAVKSFRTEGENQNISEQHSQQDLMVYLTSKLRRIQKNYNKAPEKYRSTHYAVTGVFWNESKVFIYNFLLVHQIISKYSLKLYPDKISSFIGTFGVVNDSMYKNEDHVALIIPSDRRGANNLKTFWPQLSDA